MTRDRFLLVMLIMCCCVLAAAPAGAQDCDDIDGGGWCGDPNACEQCGQPGWGCTRSCKDGSFWTTCGEWAGNPPDDLDGDGAPNGADNCLCTYNDQADCDLDGTGDACDSSNVLWQFVQDLGRCDWDGDVHWNKIVVEQYGAKIYRNACDNTYCSDRYLIDSAECPFGVYDLSGCCEQNYGSSNCIHGDCGSPACPF